MEKLITKVFEEKMKDGSIEKIINEKIDDFVKNSLNELFAYNGVIKKQMKEKLEEVMGNVLETSDFSKYVIKLQTLINEVLPETALVDYKRIAQNITEVCGTKQPNSFSSIKMSEIFKKYQEFIGKETFNIDDIEDRINIDGSSVSIDCKMELDDEKILKFTLSEEDVNNADEYQYLIKLDRQKDNKYLISYYNDFYQKRLSDLRYANSFELFILALKNNMVYLEEDKPYMEETVEVEVEY